MDSAVVPSIPLIPSDEERRQRRRRGVRPQRRCRPPVVRTMRIAVGGTGSARWSSTTWPSIRSGCRVRT